MNAIELLKSKEFYGNGIFDDPNKEIERNILSLMEEYAREQVKNCSIPFVINWVAVSKQLPERGDECWVHLNDGSIEMDLGDGDGFVNNATNNVTHWWLIEKPEPPCL